MKGSGLEVQENPLFFLLILGARVVTPLFFLLILVVLFGRYKAMVGLSRGKKKLEYAVLTF